MLTHLKTLTVLFAGAALLLHGGCEKSISPDAAPSTAAATAGHGDHGPGHEHGAGPHDGTLADWGGGQYHVEFTVSHPDKQATVYVLADDEQTPVAITSAEIHLTIADPPIDIALAAQPQSGDPDGKASRFVGSHDNLGIVQEYAGTISGEIDGTPFTGDFQEEPHAHE